MHLKDRRSSQVSLNQLEQLRLSLKRATFSRETALAWPHAVLACPDRPFPMACLPSSLRSPAAHATGHFVCQPDWPWGCGSTSLKRYF